MLAALADEFDYVFHLATYHGNQSSIADPLADHDNNLITTLKLYERAQGSHRRLRRSSTRAGCTVAEKTFGEPRPTDEDGPVSLDLDSPYQISKIVGEFYSVYYHRSTGCPTVRARFQNVYGPGEILGAGTLARHAATGLAQRHADVRLPRAATACRSCSTTAASRSRDFIYVDDIVAGLIACAERGAIPATSTTSRAASRPRSASWQRRSSGSPAPARRC